MMYKKNGVVQDEFFPQDLAGDVKGQEQASKLVRGIRLRRVLSKAGCNKEESDSFLKIWLNQLPNPHVVLDTTFRKYDVELKREFLSKDEREVYDELKSRFKDLKK